MTNFVMIHGAMHGGWFWQPVQEILVSRGHRVVAPDLAGSGTDRTPLDLVSLDLMSRRIVDVVDAHGAGEPVVLVGHSMGGLVIGEVAERAPDRVLGLVYVTAALVPPGNSLFQALGREDQPIPFTNRDASLMRMDQASALQRFYGKATPQYRGDRAARRLVPQAIRPLTEPSTVTNQVFGRIHRAYVECVEDQAVPIETQRRMQAKLPCDPVFSLEADHSPTFSAEYELADALISAAEEFEARGPVFAPDAAAGEPHAPDELVL